MSQNDPIEIQEQIEVRTSKDRGHESQIAQGRHQTNPRITNIIQNIVQGHLSDEAGSAVPHDQPEPYPTGAEASKDSPQAEARNDPVQKQLKKQQKKCALCKKHAKKPQSKMCRNCHRQFHLVCINLEKETAPKKYICDKCEFEGEEDRSSKKQRKSQKLMDKQMERQLRLDGQHKGSWLIDRKKADRDKRNGNYQQMFVVFAERYPFYVKDRDIKYPIDDSLLLIYNEIFDFEKKIPEATNHSEIPAQLVGDLMLIENFVWTFREELSYPFSSMSKRFIYRALALPYGDRVFYAILSNLLTVYLGDIMEKNKTENVRALNDHSFFILISHLCENECFDQLVPPIWREVARYLSEVPSMAKAFEAFDWDATTTDINGKLYILRTLIEGLSEIDSFHDMVSKKSERMQEMTKQRGELVTELKKEEAESLSMGQKMKEMEQQNRDLQVQIDQLSKKGEPVGKQQREQQRIRKQIQKMEQSKQHNSEQIQKNKERINDINKTICFVTTAVPFLGIDRNQSEYFLMATEPGTIYVKSRRGLLDTSSNYRLYEGRGKILEIMHALNCKGVREKSLHDSIQYFVKEGVIRDVPEDPVEMGNIELVNENEEATLSSIKGEIVEIEKRFTSYLSLRNCRWAHKAIRQSFLDAFLNRDTLADLKEDVRHLQESFLFVESLQERPAAVQADDESEDYYRPQLTMKDQLPAQDEQQEGYDRKLPIRLWGINSEKIKKFWSDYLDNCKNTAGLWICVCILRNFVERYIKKKQEGMEERQKKKEREKMKERQRERQRREREKEQKVHDSPKEDDEQSEDENKPVLRRLFRKSQRRQKYANLHEPSSDSEEQSGSSNEDACEICEGEGEVLCCDTCPKAYHLQCLKLKQVPEGEWSCFKCLQRITNERQTRSRANKNKLLME